MRHGLAIAILLVLTGAVSAQTTRPIAPVGAANLSNWAGAAADGDHAVLNPGKEISFRLPDGPRGFYGIGFRRLNDGTIDLTQYAGLRFDVQLPDDKPTSITVGLQTLRLGAADKTISTSIDVAGAGWHTTYLPWSAMPLEAAISGQLQFGKGVTISCTGGSPIGVRNVRFVQARAVALDADVKGKPCPAGGTVTYDVRVSNTTDAPQAVAFSFTRYGWETMSPTITPASIQLAPGETKTCKATVAVSDRVPPGAHETQTLLALANGDADSATQLSLVTTAAVPHPFIMHTAAGWQDVRDKIAKYDWAKKSADAYVARADKWTVPQSAQVNPVGPNPPTNVFATTSENDELAAAYAWEITGDRKYADKVRTYLLRLTDPKTGYPATLQGSNQGFVQEGHFFQHAAMAYDIIYDTLSEADHTQIDAALRLVIETLSRENTRGGINNWNLSEVCGGFYCALALQDLERANRFLAGIDGICDQLGKATMGDGWWYECSISYNMWCASEFTQAALGWERFGVNFKNEWVPGNFSGHALLTSELSGGNAIESEDPKMKGKPFGMDPSLYGPSGRPYRTITDLWDSLLPFIDYRGVMFGVNDSTENQVAGNRSEVSGQPFEIAYYAYRDPKYAAMIKLGGGQRDLLYGVPELPDKTPELYRNSAYADNVGLAMLRSQTSNRPQREQIQAALHYGTHGWAHGHYDRTDLINLERFGRSFWNPESVFYVYEPFMYKFFTQTSDNHNMVVVDQKMQEATPGKRLLFSTGQAMQATAVETTARWSNPPYGGMVYDYVPVKTFAEKMWREGRSVPQPATQPAYGTLTDFTEPILQRRMMIVTDDYVLLADYLKADKPHTFESLVHLKGFGGLQGPGVKFDHHSAQWSADPLSSAQFVTNANWYNVGAPSVAHFTEQWGPGADDTGSRSNGNEPGVLKLDIHTLWPPQQQVMIAASPENLDTEKRLYYAVRGDGKTLADGKFGAWILGRGDIDVPLAGVQQLELETRTELSKKPTLFWAGVKLVTDDGREIPLAQLPMQTVNIVPTTQPGRDYTGGDVTIAGDPYANTLPAEPKDAKQPGLIRIDLRGLHAARLTGVIGSDYPIGNDSQRRKTMAVRTTGTEARFLTLIEPFESTAVVRSAVAESADQLRVELADGRVQEITLHHFDGDGHDLSASLVESKDGKEIRHEEAASNP